MAAGARPNFFGVPGAAEHAFPLYSVADAERLRLHLQRLLQAAHGRRGAAAGGLARRRGRRRRPDRRRDHRGAGRADAGAARDRTAGRAGPDHPGRPRRRPARPVLRQGPRLRPRQADQGRRRDPARRRRHRGPRRPGRVRRRQRRSRPGPWSGAAASPARRSRRTPGPPPAAAGASTCARTCGRRAIPGSTPWATSPTSPTPRRRAHRCRSWGRWPSSRAGGPHRTSSASCTAKPPEPFVYKDKGIMAMIGRNAAVAEVGKHRHQVEGPFAFAAWLGVHAMLLSGVHSKTDAFLEWAWDYFDRDHAATVEASATPRAARLGRPRRGRPAHRPGPTRRQRPHSTEAT